MNEEMILQETTEEINTEVENTYVDSENSGGGLFTKVALGLGGLLITGAVVAVKNKDKIKDWATNRKIKKLEKKGYVITKPGETEEPKIIEAEFTDSEPTEE